METAQLQNKNQKSSSIIKITIDQKTAQDILAAKPQSIPMSTFCALLVEYGLAEWKRLLAPEQ